MKVVNDIVYDMGNDLKLDTYAPTGDSKAVLLLIHGGGWFRGDKEKENFLAEKFAENGFFVVAPNYRLAPAHLYPSALTDIFNIYAWVKNNADLKNKLVFALGASAGGNLAVELALQKGIPAASWSGIIDLYDWVTKHPEVKAVMNKEQHFDEHESREIDQDGSNDQFYKWFILNYVRNDLNLLKAATPLTRITANSGPVFLANSLHELVPISGVLKLQQGLAAVGVESCVKLIAGTIHGEGYWEKTLNLTLAFFNEQLGK